MITSHHYKQSPWRLALTAMLIMLLCSCSLFQRPKDEMDVEKLRLKYEKKGKMSALLGIIEIYEDTEQPMSARIAAARRPWPGRDCA